MNKDHSKLTGPIWGAHIFQFDSDIEKELQMWWKGLFLVDKLARKIYEQLSSDIVLWRLHRRASVEPPGHQLTLFYYATNETQNIILGMIKKSNAVKLLDRTGILKKNHFVNLGSDIDVTSDKKWPPELQKTWPHFADGLSTSYLGLIELIKKRFGINHDVIPPIRVDTSEITIKELISGIAINYIKLLEKTDNLWSEHGSHAYFHHTNAIFNYHTTRIYPRRLFMFENTL